MFPGDVIDIPRPEAEEVARFAVKQYNSKQNSNIKFLRVVDKPKARVGAGVDYNVTLEVDHAGKMLHCQAKAHYSPLMKSQELMKFQPCSMTGGSDLPTYEPARDV